MKKKVAIAVLGYNSAQYLPRLIDSLTQQDVDENIFYFYIDNASTDCSIDIVQNTALHIDIIQNTTNSGYAGAYSTFLHNAFSDGFDAVVLLNPDTIVDRSWIKNLVTYAYADTRRALTQSKILQLDDDFSKTDRISSVGGFLHYLGFGILNRHHTSSEATDETGFASGSCMLIKKEFFDVCGGLDHDFFMYLEDVDLSWRLRLHGFTCGVAQDSIVWHHYIFDRIDDKKRKKFYYLERNRLFCVWKNYSYKTLILLLPAFFVLEVGIFIHAIMHGYFREKMRANIDFIKNVPVLCKKHKIIQKGRKVHDRELFDTMISRIRFDELEGIGLRLANIFFVLYYKIIRFLI